MTYKCINTPLQSRSSASMYIFERGFPTPFHLLYCIIKSVTFGNLKPGSSLNANSVAQHMLIMATETMPSNESSYSTMVSNNTVIKVLVYCLLKTTIEFRTS